MVVGAFADADGEDGVDAGGVGSARGLRRGRWSLGVEVEVGVGVDQGHSYDYRVRGKARVAMGLGLRHEKL